LSQDNENWNIPSQPCPVCGASAESRIWSRFANNAYTHIISKKHQIMGTITIPLVCTQCGFVQLFVDPTDFRDDQVPG